MADATRTPTVDHHHKQQPRSSPRHVERVQDEEDGDEVVSQLGDCGKLYLALEDCLVDTDRAWSKCQAQVKALRACQEATAALGNSRAANARAANAAADTTLR